MIEYLDISLLQILIPDSEPYVKKDIKLAKIFLQRRRKRQLELCKTLTSDINVMQKLLW